MTDFSVAGAIVKVVLTFGLLFLTLKVLGRVYGANSAGPSRRGGRAVGQPVEVIGRTSLGRAASVVLVRLGARSYALGVSQQGVHLLAEIDTADTESEPATPARPAMAVPAPGFPARTQEDPSRSAWRDVVESLRDRTIRR